MVITSFQFKRGSSFACEVALQDDDGVPVILDVADMRVELRDGSTLIAELDIALTATPGTYLVASTEDTADWPLGVAMMDIRVESGTDIRYSDTVAFVVVSQITRAKVVTP